MARTSRIAKLRSCANIVAVKFLSKFEQSCRFGCIDCADVKDGVDHKLLMSLKMSFRGSLEGERGEIRSGWGMGEGV